MAHWSITLSEIKSSFENQQLNQCKTIELRINGTHHQLDSQPDESEQAFSAKWDIRTWLCILWGRLGKDSPCMDLSSPLVS